MRMKPPARRRPTPPACARGFTLVEVLVALGIAAMLVAGTRESATFNIVLVAIKMVALAVFVTVALPAFNGANFEPFMPYGFGSHVEGGATRGVMAAAAIVFFAFYGFDAVATSAEEARNPGRDLTIGIIGSMAACTAIYMGVAVTAIGAVSYLDVTEAERTPLATERALAQLRGAQWAATAQLVKALGGGWGPSGS